MYIAQIYQQYSISRKKSVVVFHLLQTLRSVVRDRSAYQRGQTLSVKCSPPAQELKNNKWIIELIKRVVKKFNFCYNNATET